MAPTSRKENAPTRCGPTPPSAAWSAPAAGGSAPLSARSRSASALPWLTGRVPLSWQAFTRGTSLLGSHTFVGAAAVTPHGIEPLVRHVDQRRLAVPPRLRVVGALKWANRPAPTSTTVVCCKRCSHPARLLPTQRQWLAVPNDNRTAGFSATDPKSRREASGAGHRAATVRQKFACPGHATFRRPRPQNDRPASAGRTTSPALAGSRDCAGTLPEPRFRRLLPPGPAPAPRPWR